MSKIDLFSVLELLESGDEDGARAAIHEWLVALGQSAVDSEVVTEEVIEEDSNPWDNQEVSIDLDDEGEEAGEGGSISVDSTPATPSPENRNPEAACAVEIKAEEHNGFDLEGAPEVENAPGSHFVGIDLSDLDEIDQEGDSSAMLNSGEGFGSDSPPSPIAGEEGASEKAPVKSAPKAAEPSADEPKAEEPAADDSEEEESDEEEKKEEK